MVSELFSKYLSSLASLPCFRKTFSATNFKGWCSDRCLYSSLESLTFSRIVVSWSHTDSLSLKFSSQNWYRLRRISALFSKLVCRFLYDASPLYLFEAISFANPKTAVSTSASVSVNLRLSSLKSSRFWVLPNCKAWPMWFLRKSTLATMSLALSTLIWKIPSSVRITIDSCSSTS
ncbi:hypothetical protein OGAPHI_005207 [Ogataea philodendri]|uniref:Uncharacterized protein n=1 Tax=Ogataea philodendri TaxID=1378263 RepID=A0A9P8P2C5_9ASCO|nr:uncharacterized protein OGAPHI_005207 [Ogataea philodendri]KAH3663804.1 hypothetical protein OGAPHI_005207 [Ogataea philodendri]